MRNMEKIIRLRECAIEIGQIRMQFIIDKINATIFYNAELAAIEISRQISEKVFDPFNDTPTVEVNLSSLGVVNKINEIARTMGATSMQELKYVMDNIDTSGLYSISINNGESEYLVYESELDAALERRGSKPKDKQGDIANKAYKFETDLKDHILRKKPETEDK